MVLLAAFLDCVCAALASKDGDSLAQLLSLAHGSATVDLGALSAAQVEQICRPKLARFAALGEVVAGVVLARKHVEARAFAEANAVQIASVMYVPPAVWRSRGTP
jgi:hypothetical protein